MNRLNKLATAFLTVTLIGSSLSGLALAHDGKAGRGGDQLSGKNMHHMGPKGMKGGKACPNPMSGHGMKGGIHQSKYMTLLVNAYSPETKADWDAYLKADNELNAQEQAFMKSLTKPLKRNALPKPDQATTDAHKAAHDAHRTAMIALSDAIGADKAADIATALKSLLAANKQMLVLRSQQFEALKKAIAAQTTTTTPSAAPTTTSLKYKGLPSFLQEL